MTDHGKLHREEMQYEMEKERDAWKKLNIRNHDDVPDWIIWFAWCAVWILVGVVGIFAVNKLESYFR